MRDPAANRPYAPPLFPLTHAGRDGGEAVLSEGLMILPSVHFSGGFGLWLGPEDVRSDTL